MRYHEKLLQLLLLCCDGKLSGATVVWYKAQFKSNNMRYQIHFISVLEKHEWSLVKVKGLGPKPRRRQCCCVIDNRVFLFGGTRSVCINGPRHFHLLPL